MHLKMCIQATRRSGARMESNLPRSKLWEEIENATEDGSGIGSFADRA